MRGSPEDDGYPEVEQTIPGGFAGLFFEHDPYPLVPGEPPAQTRRIVVLLTDTTKGAEALKSLDTTIRRRVPGWDVRPRVELARWTIAELRAWDRYLVNRPGLSEGLAWSAISPRQNRLIYAVWDVADRERLEAQLSELGAPCELVWIEVGTDTTGVGDMARPATPWGPRGFHFVRGCRVPPGEPPAGSRIYDLKLHRRLEGPDPRDQLTPLVERIGGRVIHRFNVHALRVSLAAKQAGFLLRADSSNVAMAIEVLNPESYDIPVYIHYPGLPAPEDFDRLEPYTVRRLSRRARPFVQTIVPDSNVPRIEQLPGVAKVRVQLGGCGRAGA